MSPFQEGLRDYQAALKDLVFNSASVSYLEWRQHLMNMQPKTYGPNYKTNTQTPTPTPAPNAVHSVHLSVLPSSVHNNQPVLNRNIATTAPATINPINDRKITSTLTRTVNKSNIRTVSSLPRTKPTAPPPKHNRIVVPVMKPPNAVPSTSRSIQTTQPNLSASLRSIYETFWSLNSTAKLVHVKSQLDEPSKVYVLKLIKTHSHFAQENNRLKREKQDLINTIKRIKLAINHETIANLIDPTKSTQPKK